MNFGTIIIIGILILALWPFISLFVTPISNKNKKSEQKVKLHISKNYPDIINTIQFHNEDNMAFRWSKIWVNDWFGKYAEIITDENLGYIKANYLSSTPNLSSFYSYSVEITIKNNRLIFAIRNIYYDNSSFKSVHELDTYVENNMKSIVNKYQTFIQSHCFHNNFNESSQENGSSRDLISFYRSLLGLKNSFTHNELKQAYREAVAKFHPDKYNTTGTQNMENAEILMKQINEAYETLKNIK